jgi:hypothetical protein
MMCKIKLKKSYRCGQSGFYCKIKKKLNIFFHTLGLSLQAALIICNLFICDFAYMQSRNGLFSGTYPLIYSNPWSFYMQICYIRACFWNTYLSHITRSTCILNLCSHIFQELEENIHLDRDIKNQNVFCSRILFKFSSIFSYLLLLIVSDRLLICLKDKKQ